MEKIALDNKALRKFGITMGIAFFVLALIVLALHKRLIVTFPVLSLSFFLLSLAAPALLRPVYIFWMKLALVLGWINTRLILSLMFYLIFTPIGLGLRLFGRDLLDRRIEKNKGSYWKKKENADQHLSDYRKQF